MYLSQLKTPKNSILIALILSALIAMTAVVRASEPPAASLAFTSKDPVVLQARTLMDAGKFNQADALLASATNSTDNGVLRARSETVELIRRVRREYSLDAAHLLVKLQASIPDASAADVERWTTEARSRFRVIDGQKFFFRLEAENIFLFSDGAKHRRELAGKAPDRGKWQLTDHLKTVVEEATRTGQTEVEPVRHTVNYKVTIHGNLPEEKTGSLVRVWLPLPQEYRQQRDVKLLSASPEPKFIAPSAVEGNPVKGAAQRTLYFEQTVTNPAKPIELNIAFAYTSYAYYPQLDEAKVQPLPADWNGASLDERLPHLAFTPAMRKQTAAVIGNETNSLAKALKIFHWVSANIAWNAEDEYATIPSFADKGFTARRGDCGVQNSVFVTMCRIAGIPARWQSGYETKPGKNWGMHDWSEIYIAPWGWLPTDASYGVKKSDDPRVADFYCGHQDSYRMIVNLDWGRELYPAKESLRSDPSDFQRGEIEVDGHNLYYDKWDYKMEIDRDPKPQVE